MEEEIQMKLYTSMLSLIHTI